MIAPGLVSVTLRQFGIGEIAERARSCGLEGIEWSDVHVPAGDVDLARRARALTRDAGLSVASYGSYYRATGAFEPTLETAYALGAPNVRVWAGERGSGVTDQPGRERIANSLRKACREASSLGMTVSLEYHGGTLTDTLASTHRLVRDVEHPALRLYWQPFPERAHSQRLAELRALIPLLSNLHVFQWTRERGETLRRPLAEGEAEWREALRTVERPAHRFSLTQGDRFALLEFVPDDDPSVLSREASTLRRLLALEP